MFTKRDDWNRSLAIAYISLAGLFMVIASAGLFIDNMSMFSLLILAPLTAAWAWIPLGRIDIGI